MAKVKILKYTWKVGLFKALPYSSTTLSIGLTERLSKEDNFYDFYLTLKPPDRFKSPHEQLSEAMKHFLNSTVFIQQYIDSEDTEEMINYIKDATSEIGIGNTYIIKATSEVLKLK